MKDRAINLPVTSVMGWAKGASLTVTVDDTLAICRHDDLAVVQLPPKRIPAYVYKVPRYVKDITLLA